MTKSTLSRELGGVLVFFCSEVMVVWRKSKKIDGTVFNRFVRGCSHLLTLGSRGHFFLLTLMVRGETASTRLKRRGEPFCKPLAGFISY